MQINWAGLGSVLVVGLAAAVLFVSLFAFGVDALARRGTELRAGRSAVLSTVVIALCFVACVGVVGFGLYKIVVH